MCIHPCKAYYSVAIISVLFALTNSTILLISMQVVNSTYALWTWHRNQDIYKGDSHGDQIYIVRQPELCLTTLKVNS